MPEDDLDTAQENKKRHIAAKLLLSPGQKVLDIGSGWGGLALYLAAESGAEVTGLTLSEEQHKVATRRAAAAGLSDRVRFHLRDYREEKGRYDRIVSVGMFEHVGVVQYPVFFRRLSELLAPDGVALLHSIGQAAWFAALSTAHRVAVSEHGGAIEGLELGAATSIERRRNRCPVTMMRINRLAQKVRMQ